MSTSNLERRIGEVLRQHAEDTMERTDTHVRYETLSRGIEDDGRRRRRGRIAGVLAVAAGVAVAALVVTTLENGPHTDQVPADEPGTPPAQVATLFMDRIAAYDFEGATSYLADDASVTLSSPTREPDEMLRQMLWASAAGYRITSRTCAVDAGSHVTCEFDFHGLGSDRLERGPYADNTFTFTVLDGKITQAEMTLAFETNGFADEMWDPFAEWVTSKHWDQAAQMYADWPGITTPAMSERSAELWASNVEAYVREFGPECICPL